MQTACRKSEIAFVLLHAAAQKANLAAVHDIIGAQRILRRAILDVLAQCKGGNTQGAAVNSTLPASMGNPAAQGRKETSSSTKEPHTEQDPSPALPSSKRGDEAAPAQSEKDSKVARQTSETPRAGQGDDAPVQRRSAGADKFVEGSRSPAHVSQDAMKQEAKSSVESAKKQIADMRTRATTNPRSQCFINATFTALCASDNARNVFSTTAARLEAEEKNTWTRLMEIASSQRSAMDQEFRRQADAGAAWTTEQRLAATYMEACKLPNWKPMVPRLLWHAFYNYNPQRGSHQQEDAQEFLGTLTDPDSNSRLAEALQFEMWQQFECRRCPDRKLHKRVVERSTVLSIEIVQEVPGSPGHFDNINSLQRALDVFFQGSIAQGNEDGILKYDDLSWFCRNPECHATDLPNHKLTMHSPSYFGSAFETMAEHCDRQWPMSEG